MIFFPSCCVPVYVCIFKAVMITVNATKLHPRENLGFYKYSLLTPHPLQYYVLFILFSVKSLIRGEKRRGPDSMVWLSHESEIIRNLLRHFELLASKGRFICDSLCYCDDRHKLRLMRNQVPVIAKIKKKKMAPSTRFRNQHKEEKRRKEGGGGRQSVMLCSLHTVWSQIQTNTRRYRSEREKEKPIYFR